MARILVDGLELDYELIGPEAGTPLVLTPGGRYPRNTAGVPELGAIFAEAGYRVLLWDRPGCGASDIAFTAPSESVMNAEALVGIVRTEPHRKKPHRADCEAQHPQPCSF